MKSPISRSAWVNVRHLCLTGFLFLAVISIRTVMADDKPTDLSKKGFDCVTGLKSLGLTSRPNSTDGATSLSVGVHLVDIDDIDGKAQTFFADFYFWANWADSRITESKRKFNQKCKVPASKLWRDNSILWDPQFEFMNLVELKRRDPETISFDDQGNIFYESRVAGIFRANFDFRQFPFDEQILVFDVQPYYPRSQLVFAFSPEYTETLDVTYSELKPSEWTFFGAKAVEKSVRWGAEEDSEFSSAVYSLLMQRDPFFYLAKIFLPIGFFLTIAWCVFWIDPREIEARVTVTITTVLAIVAYNFVIIDYLPKLSYLTVVDIFILVAYLFSGAATFESVYSFRLANKGQRTLAKRVDRWSKMFSPAVLLIALGVTYVYLG